MPAQNSERRGVYLQRKKEGYCPRCGSKKSKSEKFIYCSDCRAFFRNYNKENSEDINSIRKDRYDERKNSGQCPRCGVKLGKKYKNIICVDCLEKQYGYYSGKAKPKKAKTAVKTVKKAAGKTVSKPARKTVR